MTVFNGTVFCVLYIPDTTSGPTINIHQYRSIKLNLVFAAQISHSQDASLKAFPRLGHMPPSLKTCQYILFTLSVVHQPDVIAKLAIQALNTHVIISGLAST